MQQAASQVDLFAISLPAGTFTGDFYFTAERAERFWLALGDVAGKGLHAAVFMAMIHEELERLTSRRNAKPVSVMKSLNATMKAHMPANRFATAVLATFDASGAVTLVNAGHCPPLIRRANGEVVTVHAGGPLLGVFDRGMWCTEPTSLHQDDAILFYTDGLLEARSPSGTEYGLERIRQSFAAASGQDASSRGRAILDDVSSFTAGTRHDDLTLVVLRPSSSRGSSLAA